MSEIAWVHLGCWIGTPPTLLGAIQIGELSGLAGAIIATISLVLQIRTSFSASSTKDSWSLAKLQQALSEELALHGVIDYKIISISNYSALAENAIGECSVVVREFGTSHMHTIHVHSDGTALLVQESHLLG